MMGEMSAPPAPSALDSLRSQVRTTAAAANNLACCATFPIVPSRLVSDVRLAM